MLKLIRSKLAVNIVVAFMFLLLVFALITSAIGYQEFTTTLNDRYAENGIRIARLAAGIIDGDKIDDYLDEEYQQTEEYQTAMRRLDGLTQKMDAAFIYVIVPLDPDFNQIQFLFETVGENSGLTAYEPGYIREPGSDEYAQKYKLLMEGKSTEELVYRTAKQTTTGAHVTTLVPVVNSDGEVVGIMSVQQQMEALQGARTQFLRNVAIATLLIAVIAILLFGSQLTSYVTKPLRRIASETVRFSRENTLPEVSLTDSTRGQDELKLLAMHVDKMEYSILNYTENLKTVTSQKDRMEGELNVASGIQQGIIPNQFPAFPERDEFDLYAHMEPAKEVGGDFYDFFFVDDDHLALVIADVSGKGAPAALFMMASRIMIKHRALAGGTPADILEDVNQQLTEGNNANMFVTTWLGILDVKTGELVSSNAGHEYPAICRADGSFELFKDRHGFVLGGMSGSRYTNATIDLNPGDTLFVYTDGVTEATDEQEAFFGTEHMLAALNELPHAAPDELLHHLHDSIQTFAGGVEQADDVTMLALQFRGHQSHLRTLRLPATVENLATVSEWVEEMLATLDVPVKIRMQIALAVEEIFVNIANYAYAPGVGEAVIRMGYDIDTHTVKLAFLDQGTPYNPLEKEDPDTNLSAEDREVGGLGIFLVKETMDKVDYIRSNNWNILTLEKQSENPLS